MTIQEAARKTSDLYEIWWAHARVAGRAAWKGLSFNPVEAHLIPRDGVAISLEQDGFTILTGRKISSRIRISAARRFGREEGKAPDPERVASAAAVFLRETRQTPREVCLCIPRAWILYRTAEFPAVVSENLPGAVSFEMDRLTPLSADKSLYDFRVLDRSDDRLEIALAAARADRITPYLNSLREKGIVVNRVIVDTLALAALAGFACGGKDAVLVSVAGSRYEVGRLRESLVRSSAAGSFRGAGTQERIAEILPEIESRIEEIRALGETPRVIVASGDDSMLTLQEHLQVPVLSLRDTDLKLQYPSEGKTPSLAAAGALLASLLPDPAAMNLLDRGAPKSEGRPLIFTAVLTAVLAAMIILLLLTPLHVENRRIAEIDRQQAANREEVRKVEALRKDADTQAGEVATIRKFKDKKMLALDIMRELTTVLPKDTWLTRVRVTENSVDIEGYAKSATEILPKLEASPCFIKVEFAAPTFRDTRTNTERFVIKMELEDYRPPREESADGKKA